MLAEKLKLMCLNSFSPFFNDFAWVPCFFWPYVDVRFSIVGDLQDTSTPSPLDKKTGPISGDPSSLLWDEASYWKRV